MHNRPMVLPTDSTIRIAKDLVAASATPLVLGILAESETYGYAILKRVGELSGGRLHWTDGMLYPLLHRLERLGQVESSWRASKTGRRRKYYHITEQGHEALAAQQHQWKVVDDALRSIWHEMFSPVGPRSTLQRQRV